MSHADKLLASATAFHQAGRLDDAEKAYRKLLRVEAVHSDGLRLLGGLYLQTGAFDKATDYLAKAARLLPKDPETLTNLGIALRGVGRLNEAVEAYQKALSVRPDYVQALTNLGSLYQDVGQADRALSLFGEILRRNPDNAAAHYNYGNALFRTGKLGEAVTRYEHALQLKPDYIEAMINLGMALSHAGQGEQSRPWLVTAQNWFEKALRTAPDNVVALNNLGNVLRQQGKAEESLPCYRQALRLRPDYAEAAINLATSLRDLGRIEEAIASCRSALKYKPTSADAHINLGTFLQDLRLHDEAVDLFSEALRLNPASIDAKWNKALSLLALGRYAEGFALHEIGLGVTHMRGEYPSPDKRWHGENFAGKNLLLWSEQGLGDTLQFIRYAALAKQRGGTVIVLCPRALRRLLTNCPFIDALLESVEEHDFDLHAPMMSLPHIFGTEVETIPASTPYLFVGADARAKWAGQFPAYDGLKVGLVWAGNPRDNQLNAHMIDRRRSMTLEMLRDLFAVPGARFYNLQMGAAAGQIDSCGLRDHFIDPMGDVQDFEDTAAIMEQLDLVISVDTSVVHLAGGMGKPVWVLSRFDACWRWLQNRPDSPWYPTARVFGQSKPGDWSDVVARVRQDLQKLTNPQA